jgi:hypothetical protein
MEDLYIDKFFVENYDPFSDRFRDILPNDSKIFNDLLSILTDNRLLTKNQANLLSRLLQKYKKKFSSSGVDLDNLIERQCWKNPFREIDLTKKVYAEEDKEGTIWICLKFPYNLKSKFDEAIFNSNEKNFSHWDDQNKVRKIDLYKVNFLQILEFSKQYQLEIDQTIWNLADEIDEIWQNKDRLEKKFTIEETKINLVNASESALEYFNSNTTGKFEDNLLMAKELGHTCDSKLTSDIFQKICSVENNLFWINDLRKFLEIHRSISSKSCVILDRTSDYKKWIRDFVSLCDRENISRSEVKVCFREDNRDSVFNQWVRSERLGGKIDSGRIYIFLSTPAKWLYKDSKSFKIVLVNSLFPNTNKNTQNLINCHPLVIYAGDIKPSVLKDSKIEEL